MPDIEYAFLADAADARPGQKFAVIGGGVTRLGGGQFPLHHPHLALVCGLTVTAPEFGSEHDLQFVLLTCLLYTSPSPRDRQKSRMPSSA